MQTIRGKIPEYIQRVADVLLQNGFEAYLVGGSIRDIIIGKLPKDFDIATNAKPEQISRIFPKTVDTAAKFGTIIVVMEDEYSEPHNVEVTTYRVEADYFKGRWPSSVNFATSIKEDLSRRDFTMNALAVNLDLLWKNDAVIDEVLVDFFDGIRDINNKLIRAIGNPIERFREDGLRPIRACRFASQLNFSIEKNTFESIQKVLDIVSQISIERFRDELLKILYDSSKPSIGLDLLRQSGILKIFLPELVKCIDVRQPEFHVDDVYTHILKTVDLAQDEVKLAALFHDIGKPETIRTVNGKTTFYQHDVVGAKITENILKRLKFPKSIIKKTVLLVRYHMFYYPSADWRKQKMHGNTMTRAELEKLDNEISKMKSVGGWSDAAIRRFIARVGGIDNVNDLIKLRLADATANPKSTFSDIEIEALEKRIATILADDATFKVADLDINGKDLQKLGIKPGPQIGNILNSLLDIVIEKPELNKKDKLIDIVKNKLL